MNPAIVNQRYGNDLFNLTGDSGLVVLPNDSIKNNSIVLTGDDYDKFATANTLFIRWRILFLPSNGQAVVRGTDYVQINASAHIEGIQRMDSLFHAGP